MAEAQAEEFRNTSSVSLLRILFCFHGSRQLSPDLGNLVCKVACKKLGEKKLTAAEWRQSKLIKLAHTEIWSAIGDCRHYEETSLLPA